LLHVFYLLQKYWKHIAVKIDSFMKSVLCVILNLSGHEDEIYTKLNKVPNVKVNRKEEMDRALHYRNNRRILPLIVSTLEGYRLCKNAATCNQVIGNNTVHRPFHLHFVCCVALLSVVCFNTDDLVFMCLLSRDQLIQVYGVEAWLEGQA